MLSDTAREELVAFGRFGPGARPGDLRNASSDSRGLLKAELRAGKAPIEAATQLASGQQSLRRPALLPTGPQPGPVPEAWMFRPKRTHD